MNDLHLTQPRAHKSQILLTITLHGVHDLAICNVNSLMDILLHHRYLDIRKS